MFFGRKKETALLEDCYRSQRSELITIYGRRRIGKSRLVKEFIKGKNALTFEAIEGDRSPQQIKHFTHALREQLNDPVLKSVEFRSWTAVFDYLTESVINKRTGRDKFIIFLDEFQWMAAGQSQLVGLLKNYWDLKWKEKNIMLILCGSIASFMVRKVIRSKSLYGRITLELLLKGLEPNEAISFFKNKRGKEEALKYLMILGGVPRYLEEIDLNRSFPANMNRLFFSPQAYMFNEFEKIFYSQFKETNVYIQIVRHLSKRIMSLEELSARLKIPSGGGLVSYLENLENAEMIRNFVAFGRNPTSKLKKYKLSDEYFNFYFKYIEPNKNIIKNSPSERLFETITQKSLDTWLGFAFERFCIKHAGILARAMGFEDEVLEIAPLFSKNDESFQIDCLYLRTSNIVTMCEMKYCNEKIGTKVIPEVERKCALLKLPKSYTLEKALVSIHGPDNSLRDSEYFHHCVSIEDIFKAHPAATT